jgi:hypothetical protein
MSKSAKAAIVLLVVGALGACLGPPMSTGPERPLNTQGKSP